MKHIFLLFQIYFFKTICAEEYKYFECVDKHYKFHTEMKTWFEARIACRSEGATLAMPKDMLEARTISNYYKLNHLDLIQDESIWIGFHDHFTEGEYVTLQGESLQYYFHTWRDYQPDNFNNEDCGTLRMNGFMNDLKCNSAALFVCQKENKTDPAPSQLSVTCKDDPAYKCSPKLDMCYKLHWNARAWPDARTICAAEGGRLAIIRNVNVENFLVEMLRDPNNVIRGTTNVLIGFHDLFAEGHYINVDDTPLDSVGYSNWMSGQPEGSEIKNCGSMRNDGYLEVFSCTTPANFICERFDNAPLNGAKSSKIDKIDSLFYCMNMI